LAIRGGPAVRGVDKVFETPHLKILICFESFTNATGLDCSSDTVYRYSRRGRGEKGLD
jgi:hypothetical protein